MAERITIPEHQRFEVSAAGAETSDSELPADERGTREPNNAEPGVEGSRIPIQNAATDADSDHRRSGGSVNDPHGGHDLHGRELATQEADPVEELVPGGQGAEAPPYSVDRLTDRLGQFGSPDSGRATDDVAPATLGSNAPGVAPGDMPPAVDPVSQEGLHRQGMSEGTPTAVVSPYGHDDATPETLAYKGAQKPNLPDTADPDLPREADGAGSGQEPVERRDDTFVFDERTGNFEIKDEEHGTGVTSQDFEKP